MSLIVHLSNDKLLSVTGWVELFRLLQVPMMKFYSARQVLEEVEKSTSVRGTKRFERKFVDGSIYVRAVYSRRIERVSCCAAIVLFGDPVSVGLKTKKKKGHVFCFFNI